MGVSSLITKSAIIIQRIGIAEKTHLGELTAYRDDIIDLESFLESGLNIRISYSISNAPAVEVWQGRIINHPGDHSDLQDYIDVIFASL